MKRGEKSTGDGFTKLWDVFSHQLRDIFHILKQIFHISGNHITNLSLKITLAIHPYVQDILGTNATHLS